MNIEHGNMKNELKFSKICDDIEQYDDDLQKITASPGTILRNMREQDKMTVKATAKKLCLETSMIRSLECDQYDVLPSVFVRGYLRNYAKLQKIPQQTIMESFDTMINQQPVLSPVKPKFKPYLMNQNIFNQDFLSIFVIFIALITFMTWIWQFYPTINHIAQSFEKPWSSSNFMVQTVEQIAISDIALPTVMAQTATIGSDIALPTVQINIDTPVSAEESIPTFANQYQILRIHFKDKAWIRLVDKERKKLYQGIGSTGEILSLEGIPPFNIKVGNFAGVYIEYNDKIDNVKKFPRSKSNKRTFIVGNNT